MNFISYRCLTFGMSALLTVSVSGVCVYHLLNNTDPSIVVLYTGLLGGMITVWLKNLKSDENNIEDIKTLDIEIEPDSNNSKNKNLLYVKSGRLKLKSI